MDNNPTSIILHHSLTKDNIVLNNTKAIKKYHIDTNGWSDIGYHWILEKIDNMYRWVKGRKETTRGAHCLDRNFDSIGICIVGDYDKDYLCEEQIQMILQKQIELEIKHDRKLPLELHRTYADYKTCPGSNITLDLFKDDSVEFILNTVTDTPIKWLEFIETHEKMADADVGALKHGKYLKTLIKELYNAIP